MSQLPENAQSLIYCHYVPLGKQERREGKVIRFHDLWEREEEAKSDPHAQEHVRVDNAARGEKEKYSLK